MTSASLKRNRLERDAAIQIIIHLGQFRQVPSNLATSQFLAYALKLSRFCIGAPNEDVSYKHAHSQAQAAAGEGISPHLFAS